MKKIVLILLMLTLIIPDVAVKAEEERKKEYDLTFHKIVKGELSAGDGEKLVDIGEFEIKVKNEKYSLGVKEILENEKYIEREKEYEIVVYSQFDKRVQDLIPVIQEQLPERISNLQERTFDSCCLKTDMKVIEKLYQLPEVRKICLLSETRGETDFITEGELSNDFDGIRLNSLSEMMGIKKARTDFNVTGDLDGNEAVYSRDDVVIAVIDSGIDATHVDLDNGKVIAWYDAVDGSVAPQDSQGHGTHVASIAAGTGEGDPLVQSGVAPGAALIGVKVFPVPLNTGAEYTLKGLEWIYENLISAIVLDEGDAGEYKRLHIAVWEPGKNPYTGDSSTFLAYKNDDIPQNHLKIPLNQVKEGIYYIAVIGGKGENIRYTLEVTGCEILPR